MLGTNGKLENNPSLLGMKFDAISWHTYIIATICFPFIPITLSSMRARIMGHIQSSNSFIDYKTLHMIVVD
jgi:hypothetical protein